MTRGSGTCSAAVSSVVAFVGAFASIGCDVPPLADGRETDEVECYSCHGGPDNPAPPSPIAGGVGTTNIGVGAHQAHLVDGDLRAALSCNACHVVPETVDAPGHVDALPAEVAFGRIAAARGNMPLWNRREASCSNIACHGSGLSGGTNVRPIWTQVDGTQTATCSACHGAPPPAPHPQTTDCASCHSRTVDPAGDILVADGFHIDGVIDVDPLACTTCHGSLGDPSPPRGVNGEIDVADRAVGAHRAHLREADWHATVACDECHVVPATVRADGHIDTPLPAELTWGTTATADGATTPVFDGVGCSNVACHGGGLVAGGGSNTSPQWTKVDGTQATCGSCHSLPPAGDHPDSVECATCHDETMASRTVFKNAQLHIDGKVQVDPTLCTACHGSDGNPAPPSDTAGNTATTERGVGAHRTHLANADWHASISCDECHAVPSSVDAPGHNDSALPAELTFGGTASAGDVLPLFDGLNCTVYCHGAGLEAGGSNTSPLWTTVDGSQAACGTCHGVPPSAPHPVVTPTSCGGCHPFSGLLPIDPARHIDGTLDLTP